MTISPREVVMFRRLALAGWLAVMPMAVACAPGGHSDAAARAAPGAGAKAYDANMRATDLSLRGEQAAEHRPALGFGLQTTAREAVEAWAYAVGGHCFERNYGLTLECVDLPLSRISAVPRGAHGTLWARFDTANRLRELTAVTKAQDAIVAAHTLHKLTENLAKRMGPPHKQHRDVPAAYLLGSGGFTHSVAEYRFADYYAKVSATSTGRDGFRIVQQYRALEH